MGLTNRTLTMGIFAVWAAGAAPGTLLTGSAFDPAGYPMPNAIVSLRRLPASASNEQTTHTDSAGNFSFSNLTAGTYFLRVESPGFKVWVQNDLQVGGAPELHLPSILMQIGQICPGLSAPPPLLSRIWAGMKRFFTGSRPDLTICY